MVPAVRAPESAVAERAAPWAHLPGDPPLWLAVDSFRRQPQARLRRPDRSPRERRPLHLNRNGWLAPPTEPLRERLPRKAETKTLFPPLRGAAAEAGHLVSSCVSDRGENLIVQAENPATTRTICTIPGILASESCLPDKRPGGFPPPGCEGLHQLTDYLANIVLLPPPGPPRASGSISALLLPHHTVLSGRNILIPYWSFCAGL